MEYPRIEAIKIQNTISLITTLPSKPRSGVFGYADDKLFDYFLIACNMVSNCNHIMSIMARSKRIALSVDPEYHQLLMKLAEFQNKTVTAVVTDLLEASRPGAESMLVAFQEFEKGIDQATILKNLLASGLEGAAKNIRN